MLNNQMVFSKGLNGSMDYTIAVLFFREGNCQQTFDVLGKFLQLIYVERPFDRSQRYDSL
jgi:hypothetical protein